MEKGENTKRKVMEAAVSLFNVKGFSGTSIRAIANKANVNVALISYYFGNKQGLMEKLMIEFLEGYTNIAEKGYLHLNRLSAKQCLYMVVENLLKYQQQNHHLARFVHREVTLDSTLVRELMMTYFMKEKHFIKEIIEVGVKQKEFRPVSSDFAAIQIRALVTMPYSQPQYIREVYHLTPHENYFVHKYLNHVEKWLNEFLNKDANHSKLNTLSAN
ncbi:forespore capture DNA-binding protein RefZ [Anaerobacillus isosaccharinicus]|uniref:Forespore capture DNA-binding protein RefZ n=1 Tax=Anaerobacillus isosaccharinicus TaxID=1532552 RepID=A0A1S2LVJ6_9BACI|nr:forespore capture DNA-binding protein RefZ [Anaerobacillus isosaccharinicus]MBA5587977.1 forespore capture DNA-binding protein RefZ [Anaerobacillus isosaccharinicus]QOY38619.1 forespore capture DNA-binding protein RefZ [Anaerobacillus isosaccharinicus]